MKKGLRATTFVATGVIGGLLLIFGGALFLRALSGVPTNGEVRREFEQATPNARVVDIGVGEGNDEAAWFYIRFRTKGDPSQHEAVWLYVKGSEGKWKVTHRDQVP